MGDSPAGAGRTVVLIGNPNTGKSTLFTALCGVRQRVGNYPGVTVEKKVGRFRVDGQAVDLVDLPGTYSLAPRSPDEAIAVDVLLGRQAGIRLPDVILCIVDASNLERNLYLVSQLLELERPLVIALNMTDVAEAAGVTIDAQRLSKRLGVPVVPLVAHRRTGIDQLRRTVEHTLTSGPDDAASRPRPFPEAFYRELDELADEFERRAGERPPRFLLERLLLDQGGYLEQGWEPAADPDIRRAVESSRRRLAEAGYPVPAVEAMSRYDWVGRVLEGVVRRSDESRSRWSDRLDRILTHRLLGTLIFAVLMVAVFQAIFSGASWPADRIDEGIGWLQNQLTARMAEGPFTSLLADGVVAGVGAVLVFLPQIVILFVFLAILEDCGYMARAAFLMDRLMAAVGLNGKAFIPLLSSFACAVPGIMATRVIENRRDRLTTILVAPLMSCSARLPVYVLLTAAFIPPTRLMGSWFHLQGLVIASMYFLGIITAMVAAWCFRRWLFPGETPPLVMELPPYKWPSFRVVAVRVTERAGSFVKRAGTMILAVTVLVWAAASYPRSPAQIARIERAYETRIRAERAKQPPASVVGEDATARRMIEELEYRRDAEIQATILRGSLLGRIGQAIEPVVRPLGWDWRIGCAVVASFPAREVVIGAMGVIYSLGEDQQEDSRSLQETLRTVTWEGTNRRVFNIPVALSLMVFFSLCAQCAATLAVMRRETNSWRWPVFAFTYMTSAAYLAALVIYHGARWWLG